MATDKGRTRPRFLRRVVLKCASFWNPMESYLAKTPGSMCIVKKIPFNALE